MYGDFYNTKAALCLQCIPLLIDLIGVPGSEYIVEYIDDFDYCND